jgi:signal transduction histidine kinase
VPREVHGEQTQPISLRQILVVDDVPANILAVEAALAPLRRPIVSALSGKEALGRLLDADFSLVLLDVQMPDMDGYETAQWIRSRERSRLLPIIFLTAYSSDTAAILRGYQLGAVDFLFKPIEPAILRAKADVFLTLQDRTEELAAERLQNRFDTEKQAYEAKALRREMEQELAGRQQLALLNQELENNDRRKDEFLAILAHELRNPIAPIRTAIDLMRRAPNRPATPRMIDVFDRQLNVLTRLVDDLLDVSRITANKIELRPQPMDLRDAVELAISTSRPSIEQRRHRLELTTYPEPIHLVGDAVRLVQVISNLLNNAARYTEPGGTIEIVCGMREGQGFVQVTDSGIGIPPELLASIFDMFVQERVRSDGSGGLGLGLALARHLVELHRGAINVTSPGRGLGSTFEVLLPLAGSADTLKPRRRTGDMPPLTRDTQKLRAVIVDDNEDAREMLAHLLTECGHDVQAAADGPSGLALICAQRPDVALVDLGLPGMDGYELIRAVHEICPDLKTRLIALTGYGDPQHQTRVIEAGFHVHLVKPATLASILDSLTA